MTAVVHKGGRVTGYSMNQNENPETGVLKSLTGHLGGFMIIGGITTCTDISLLWVCTDLFGIWYLVSASLSYCISALLSFGLNKLFNFKNGSPEHVKQASVFLVIATSSLVLNLLIISGCVEFWALNYLMAKVLATGIAFLWNYFGQSCVTFRLWR